MSGSTRPFIGVAQDLIPRLSQEQTSVCFHLLNLLPLPASKTSLSVPWLPWGDFHEPQAQEI